MRIGVIGAGMAGLTFAALIRRYGHAVELFERAADFSQTGYALGLWPMGSRVLNALGLRDRFEAVSQPAGHYRVRDGQGEPVVEYSLERIRAEHGAFGTLMRGELLDLLRSAEPDIPLRFNCELQSLVDDGQGVEARFADGSSRRFDLLVGTDGIHSTVRRLLYGDSPDTDTGWGCWVWTSDAIATERDLIEETWAARALVGTYPTRRTVCAIAGGASAVLGPTVTGGAPDAIAAAFSELHDDACRVVSTFPADPAARFWWQLSDHRVKTWYRGRVALMGDSACAFLPTAGVGASMALESAAVLADELSRAELKFLERSLHSYAQRRQKRAEAAQDDSRTLAKYMLVDSRPLAWVRDRAMHFYSLDRMLASIQKSLVEPI